MLHVSYTFPPNNPHVVRERDEAMNVNWQVPWKVWKVADLSPCVMFSNWKCSH